MTTEPRYPALARLLRDASDGGVEYCWACNPTILPNDDEEHADDCMIVLSEKELADAERMAQQIDAQHALLTRLAGSANEMKGMIERNELIRNTQADIKSDYIQRMMVFVQRLQKFDAALAEARAAGVVTE